MAPAFPGAPVEKTVNKHYGIDPERAAFVTAILRDSSVVQVVEASVANTSKRVKYRLKARRFRLFKRLEDEMTKAKLKPISWGYFWMLTSDRQYEFLTVDNCCCGTCRDQGFYNYMELRSIINDTDSALRFMMHGDGGVPGGKDRLLKRIDKEEEFRRGLFQTYLKDQDKCGAHCRRMLLSTYCNASFKKPCTHGCEGGAEPPRSIQELLCRKPLSSDYNDLCMVCSDRNPDASGNVLCCTHCNLVAHRRCVERTHWDLDKKKAIGRACAV